MVSLLFCSNLHATDPLEFLNVLSFTSDDGQIVTSMNCRLSERDKPVQHCQVLATVYTEDLIDMASPQETRDVYLKKSKAEAEQIAASYCDEVARNEKILSRTDLLAGRRSHLERDIKQDKVTCACKGKENPNACLANGVGDWPRQKRFCNVSAVSQRFVMKRNKGGSWVGELDRDGANFCASKIHLEIKEGEMSFGVPTAVMKWRSTGGQLDLPVCKLLGRTQELRMYSRVPMPVACDSIWHQAMQ